MNAKRIYFLIQLCFFTILPGPLNADVITKITFANSTVNYIGGRVEAVSPKSKFDCLERVFGVFEIQGLHPGEHHLKSRWKSPNGDIWNSRVYTYMIDDDKRTVYFSSFVEINPSSHLFSFLNQSAGFESHIGIWKVEVLDGDHVQDTATFRYIC